MTSMNVRGFLVSGFFALLLAPALPAQSPAPAHAGKEIVTAFWNIRWFPGGRPNAYRAEQEKQTRAVHADIVKLNADVIGFEEVRDWENAGLAVRPLEGFKVDVCSTFPPREGQTETQQVAIVSRLQPISAWAEEWKPGAAVTPPRGFAFAAYELAAKKLLLVYALHLKSNRGDALEDIAIREESMRQLIDHMKAMNLAYRGLGEITWVVGGDFNTAPDDPRFKDEKTTTQLTDIGFQWVWKNMPKEQRITMPPDKRFPAATFDHIFFRGATLRKAEVIPTAEASSDHRAVRGVFAF